MEPITLKVTSVSPLLMSSPAGMMPSDNKPKLKTIPTPADEAESQAYRLGDGQLYHPAPAFRTALLSACAGLKVKMMGLGTIMRGAVFTIGEFCPLTDHDDKPIDTYDVDIRRCVLQKKTAIMRARPIIREWATEVMFEYDAERIAAATIADRLNAAGQIIGVGNYRPEKGGPYGRFTAELA